jgi:hypothetical protein
LSHLFLRHALSAIAFFSAIPRAFYHAANVLGLDFLTHAVNNKAQQATRRFRRWVNRYRIGDASFKGATTARTFMSLIIKSVTAIFASCII